MKLDILIESHFRPYRYSANGCEGKVTDLFNGMRFVVDVDGRLDRVADWASLIRQCGGESSNTVSNEVPYRTFLSARSAHNLTAARLPSIIRHKITER